MIRWLKRLFIRRKDAREWDVSRREREADELLYAQDQAFAVEMGYEPPQKALPWRGLAQVNTMSPQYTAASLQALAQPHPLQAQMAAAKCLAGPGGVFGGTRWT